MPLPAPRRAVWAEAVDTALINVKCANAMADVPDLFYTQLMTSTIKTLGQATRHRLFVMAECRTCKRSARFLASDLASIFGHGRNPYTLKFKCTNCDSSNCTSTLEWPDFERTHEHYVWRPVKVKGDDFLRKS